MDPLAPVIRWLIAPAWAVWERSDYLRHYRRLKRAQFDSADEIRSRQWRAAREMLDHAYRRTPFWRDRLDALGIQPADIRCFDDFRQLPVLTKQDLQTQDDRLLADGVAKEKLYAKRTSGSTGMSVHVWVADDDLQRQRACTLRSDEWTGWRLGERVAMVWGNPDYLNHGWRGRLRNALLDRAQYLDTLRMDESALREFHRRLRRRPPALIMGHAHSLYLLAQFLKTQGGPGFRPKGILSTAMVLHDWERKLIEDVFACPVTNRYGAEEVSLIACECEQHQGLHINADGVLVETISADGSPCEPGVPGAVVVSDLMNRAMPIIRYQIGDVAVLSDRTCPCGRGLPLIERIEGRVADYVVTPSGQLISGISLTENLATQVPGLAQMQIVQEAVDTFLFRLVKGHDFSPDSLTRLGELVLERFGDGVTFQCQFVDHIPREASGKYRFCISHVENPFHRAACEDRSYA